MTGQQPEASPGEVPQEELRFAVVLNGGVSLAVWMGGVALELDRLTRGDGPYAVLLDLVRSTARADVIAGTSAGGINGAALALAQVNEHADLATLRDIWAEQGRMESLLRQPFAGAPASLLKGDEYFLPELAQAMSRLVEPFAPTPVEQRPIDLTITTTLLHGARTVTVDALGQRLPQTVHDGRFRFRRDPAQAPPAGEAVRDDFTAAAVRETAARLAVASRSTAGFPVAFEPSFVPAGAPGDRPDALLRPDMSQSISWRTTGPTAETPPDRSRFTVDGGLLANTPTRSALEAIDRMPAEGPVRRVLLLVYPHAPADAPDPADDRAAAPTLAETVGGVLGALSSQGSRTFVDEVEAHNRIAGSHRGSRSDVLRSVSGSPRALYVLVHAVAAHYRALRMRRAARDLAARVPSRSDWSYERIRHAAEAAQLTWDGTDRGPGRPRLPYVPDGPLPLPLPPPAAGPPAGPGAWAWGATTALGVVEAALDLLRRMAWVTSGQEAEKVGRAREVLYTARTGLREARRDTDAVWEDDPVVASLPPGTPYWTLRLAAYEWLLLGTGGDTLERARRDLVADTMAAVGDMPPAEVDRRRGEVEAAVARIGGAAGGSVGRAVAGHVADVVEQVAGLLGILEGLPAQRLALADLECWRDLLGAAPAQLSVASEALAEPAGEAATPTRVLSRLLALEVATSTLVDELPTGSAFPVDLVQVSLQVRNGFAHYTRTGDDKLGGMAVARFGGFLKRSWRLNDWTWGRLDAASVLSRVVLDPQRLRRVAVLRNELTDDPKQASVRAQALVQGPVRRLFAGAVPDDQRIVDARAAAVEEVAAVFRSDVDPGSLPSELPALAGLAAWALHLRIAAHELPAVAAAVRADRVDGANRRSRGEFFLEENASLLRALEELPPEAPLPGAGELPQGDPARSERLRLGLAALDAFDRAGIGREPLQEEGTSDQMMRTVTTAAGVGVTVLDGEGSGLSAARPVTRTLRGLVLLPYWTITGLARGGAVAGFLALLALSLGGTLVALSLFGVLSPWASGPAAALGFGALLGAFGYAALRTGSVLHGLVLLSPVVPLLAFAVDETVRGPGADDGSGTRAASTVVVVGLLVLGLMLLGSLPAPLGSPLAAWTRSRERWGARLAAARTWLAGAAWRPLVVLVVLVALAAAILFRGALDDAGRAAGGWVADHPWTWPLLGMAALVVGWIVAARNAGGFKLYRARRPPAEPWELEDVVHPAGSAAGWAVVYGALYLLVAGLLALFADTGQRWVVAGLVTALVFAAVLLLVVPWLVPMRARSRLGRSLVADATPEAYGLRAGQPHPDRPQVERALVDRLVTRSLSYRFLCRYSPARAGSTGAPGSRRLSLTPAGRRWAGRVHRQLAVARGVPERLAGADLSGTTLAPRVSERVLADLEWTAQDWAADLLRVLRWSDGLVRGPFRLLPARECRTGDRGLLVGLTAGAPEARADGGTAGPAEHWLDAQGRVAVCHDGRPARSHQGIWSWLEAELGTAGR